MFIVKGNPPKVRAHRRVHHSDPFALVDKNVYVTEAHRDFRVP